MREQFPIVRDFLALVAKADEALARGRTSRCLVLRERAERLAAVMNAEAWRQVDRARAERIRLTRGDRPHRR